MTSPPASAVPPATDTAAPPDAAAPADAVGAAPARHTGLGIKAAVVTAVVSALVGAFINREHLDFLASKVSAPRPAVPALKLATDPTGAVSVKIPEEWGVVRGRFNVPFLGRQPTGAAFQVGSGTALRSDGINFTEPSAFIAASTQMGDMAGIAARSDTEVDTWLRAAAKDLDWSKEGCAYESEEWAAAADLRLNVQIWRDCNGLTGTHLVSVFGASRGRGLVVVAQMFCDSATSLDTARAVVSSLAVREEKLPRGTPSDPEPGAPQVPAPAWLPEPSGEPTVAGDLLLP